MFRKSICVFVIFISFLTTQSCGNATDARSADSTSNTGNDIPKFQAITISVDENNINTLMILLANDGTINRKGKLGDTTDHDFFMGMSKEPFFDSACAAITNDLMAFCDKAQPKCDSTTTHCSVKLSFSSRSMEKDFLYCTEESFEELPAAIKDYVLNAQRVTAAWHQEQVDMTKK